MPWDIAAEVRVGSQLDPSSVVEHHPTLPVKHSVAAPR